MNDQPQSALQRQDVILLLAAGANGPYDFDPIRIMKGCFYVSQKGLEEWRSLFDFKPYDYGPFDTSVYRARDALVSKELLSAEPMGRYAVYSLTDGGKARVQELETTLGEQRSNWFRQVGSYMTSKSFTSLLEEIYKMFPEFATQSVMRSSQP